MTVRQCTQLDIVLPAYITCPSTIHPTDADMQMSLVQTCKMPPCKWGGQHMSVSCSVKDLEGGDVLVI